MLCRTIVIAAILLPTHTSWGADSPIPDTPSTTSEIPIENALIRPDAPASDPRTEAWVQRRLSEQGLTGEELENLTQQVVASLINDEQFESKLDYKMGSVEVADGLATFALEDGWRWLDGDDASRVLTHWGNPVMHAPLGMIFPEENSATDGWGVIIRFEEDGFVEDEDAQTIDYASLLIEMQQDTAEGSEQRVSAGYETVNLVGWAQDPHYDSQTNKLYWAKELQFGSEETSTLNYDVRALGRRGVMSMNAVAGMDQLTEVQGAMEDLIDQVDFNDGHRYGDFDPKMDRIAAYGIGALIAGKLTAKTGLLKVLLGILIAGKKFGVFILLGALAVGKSLWGRVTGAQPTDGMNDP